MVLHDTSRGPATGGIRLYPYQNEELALADGFKLARAMTFKAAAADLPVGGGKIVLVEHPELPAGEVYALFFMGFSTPKVYRTTRADALEALQDPSAFNLA